MRDLKLGTRRSLLAWAQSQAVANAIEQLSIQNAAPVKVQLVGIETRGDRIQDQPLQAVQGKEFFVAELDQALLSGEVDFTVHSLKDLSLERPADIACSAIPRRENPRDVVLFSPDIVEKIKRGEKILIGTSSPRRLENIPDFLEKALPQFHQKPHLEFLEIRGNVNTRLSRLWLEGPKKLDAVVLAFAGLIRLWNDPTAREEMKTLLRMAKWMVLPLRECPTAPGQGALAIECRKSDTELRLLLSQYNDPETTRHVSRERAFLKEWGGGCHQKFGATSMEVSELGDLFYVRGKMPDDRFIDRLDWVAPRREPGEICVWDGSMESPGSKAEIRYLNVNKTDFSGHSVFIAHARAFPKEAKLEHARIWTSGVQSWFKLAKRGVWVEGCAEGMGFSFLKPTLKEEVLELSDLKSWVVLTHLQACQAEASGWEEVGEVIPVYETQALPPGLGQVSGQILGQATHFYWHSSFQYQRLEKSVPKDAHHACGPGKTAHFLRRKGLDFTVFPSPQEWRKWIKEG